MLKKRVIPVLLLKSGYLVKSKGFSKYQNIGNALWAVHRMSQWGADELIYLDITNNNKHDIKRDDLAHGNPTSIQEIVKEMAKSAFMPISIGGGIRSIKDIEERLQWGADKVVVNTLLATDPKVVLQASKEFGAQCLVASIDCRREAKGFNVFTHNGQFATQWCLKDWAMRAENLGIGEVLINSINNDGKQCGYDIEMINTACDAVTVPVIGQGGAGDWFDFEELFDLTEASGAAAANIFHYRDQSVYLAKKYLYETGKNIRAPKFQSIE